MWNLGCFSLIEVKGFGEVHAFLNLGLFLEDLEGFLGGLGRGNIRVVEMLCKSNIVRNLLLNRSRDGIFSSAPSLNSSISDGLHVSPFLRLLRPNLMEARFRGCSFLPREIHPANVFLELGFQGLFIA